MGHKTHPIAFRLPLTRKWQGMWYANKKGFAALLLEDLKIRSFVEKKLKNAGIGRVEIERTANLIKIRIFVIKPGLVIGRGGRGMETLKQELMKLTSGKLKNIDVVEIKTPDLWANLIASGIAGQIERRYPHKRAVSQALEKVMAAGARGIKVEIGGRLGGAEIARSEKKTLGVVSVSTLQAEVDFGKATAQTKFGTIGIKTWINKTKS